MKKRLWLRSTALLTCAVLGTACLATPSAFAETGADNPAASVISVDVEWDAMEFTYTEASKGTWLPSEHRYEGGTPAKWSEDVKKLTVTNQSNAAVVVGVTVELPQTPIVRMMFFKPIEGTTRYSMFSSTDITFGKLLESAEGKTAENAPRAEYYVGINDYAYKSDISSDTAIGTLVVTLRSESAEVSTKEELFKAATLGGTVKLLADIDIGENQLSLYNSVCIDLNGHKIKGNVNESAIYLNSLYSPSLTVKNGTVENTMNMASAIMTYGKLQLTSCDLIANNYMSLYVLHDTVVRDCTFTGNLWGDAVYCGNNSSSAKRTVEFGGNISIAGNVLNNNTATVTVVAVAGTYNFDPTAYVDADAYTVTDNGDGSYTVTEKSA